MYLKFNNDNHITYRIYLFLSPFPAPFLFVLSAKMDSHSSHSFYESISSSVSGSGTKENLMLM